MMTKLTVKPSGSLSEEEWQAAGDEFVATLPPLERKPQEPSSVRMYVEAHLRAAKRKSAKPKGTYNPLTRRRR
jgi:hypothetical protein